MLTEYENPSKFKFWFKWFLTITLVVGGGFGCFKFIEMKKGELDFDLNQRVFASERQMIQIANGINLFNASYDPKELTGLAGYEALMNVLKDKKLLNSVPKNTISNFEFHGDGLEFIGMQFEDKVICTKFMNDYSDFTGLKKFKGIKKASEKTGYNKNGIKRIFCYQDKSIKTAGKYVAAFKIN